MKRRHRLPLLVLILLATVATAFVPVGPVEACYTCGTHTPPWGDPPESFCLGEASSAEGWWNCVPQTEGCIMFWSCAYWDVRCD